MNENTIVVDNIAKIFQMSETKRLGTIFNPKKQEKIMALDGISFSVSKGEVFGIMGPNGSGKTTLLRIISGIYPPSSGSVHIYGKMAPLLQIGLGFNNELDAIDNIVMYGMLLGLKKSVIKQRIDTILEFAELQKFAYMKLKHYSAGMRVRLAFATSLQIDPDILLVDEVLAVGDARFKEKSFNAFMSFKEQGKTIIYTSHNVEQILTLCDRVLLLHEGKMVICSTPDETIKKYRELLINKK